MVTVFFIIHPTILKYLVADLSRTCWSSQHLTWSLLVALPGILVWGVLTPLIAIVVLHRNKEHLDKGTLKAKFGFLYQGYQRQYYFWELIILVRKLGVITIVVFLVVIERRKQALICLTFLFVTYVLQKSHQPYVREDLNLLESKSLLVGLVTIYCGLYFVSDELSETSQLVLFLTLISLNGYFFSHWIAIFVKRLIVAW
eukprot:CAMPEP_0115027274 /NCGR_PEP_ID=MMETSP0216-20121206/35388_1 /TAXON_ID=223996 /ORGANISM="Protocruzia adherens, Strain Boccale" /LENGTH=199 /DNA_ID=CAMNT_0002402797 /DNA_START=88 /DNA_END=684 /DNA_ORIENTATION=-